MLRDTLGHPIMPISSKGARASENPQIDFRGQRLNLFTLKYLGKFIYEAQLDKIHLYGGELNLHAIKHNMI